MLDTYIFGDIIAEIIVIDGEVYVVLEKTHANRLAKRLKHFVKTMRKKRYVAFKIDNVTAEQEPEPEE